MIEDKCERTVRFIVPGKPVGYYAHGLKPNHTRMQAYHRYKQVVGEYAALAGLSLPLQCSEDSPIWVNVVCYFPDRIHCDPGNVQKGICDALFWSPKKAKVKGANDKYTGGRFAPPRYDKHSPRVEVEVVLTKPCQLFETVENVF